MATIQSIIFYLVSTIFFFGPSLRINISNISVPLFDIFLIIYTLTSVINKKIKNKFFLYFALWTILSFLISQFSYNSQKINIFYLIRIINFCLLFSFYPVLNKNKINYLNLIIIANLIFGLIQYFVWPDQTSFSYYGWDPHLNRLTSTFLDPTFTAFVFLIFLLKNYFSKSNKYILIFIYICIALTYSRATFLSLIVASLFVSINKKKFLIFIKTTLLIVLTILILPNKTGEGTNIRRTSTILAKIENYKQSISLISQKPLIGHGYNNLDIVKQTGSNNHANFGFDSSLMTIASTTGLIGLSIFLLAFYKLFKKSCLSQQTIILSLFVHSLFSNSLLYIWIYFVTISYLPVLIKNHK